MPTGLESRHHKTCPPEPQIRPPELKFRLHKPACPTNLTPWSRDFSPGGQAKVSSPTHTALEACPNSPRDDHRQVTSFDGFVAGRVGGVDSHRIPPWLESSRV